MSFVPPSMQNEEKSPQGSCGTYRSTSGTDRTDRAIEARSTNCEESSLEQQNSQEGSPTTDKISCSLGVNLSCL